MGKTDIQINGSEIIINTAGLNAGQVADIKSVIDYQEEIPDENNPITEEQIIDGEPVQVTIGFNMKPNPITWTALWAKYMVESFKGTLESKVRSVKLEEAEADIKIRTDII